MDVNISNAKYCRYPIYKELRGERSNVMFDLAKDIQKQEKEILDRMSRTINIFGNKVTPDIDLQKLEEELNINQKNMLPLQDIVDPKDEEKIIKLVIDYLRENRMLEIITIGTTGSTHMICKPPHTSVYLKPYLREGMDKIYIKEVLAISKEILNYYQGGNNHE